MNFIIHILLSVFTIFFTNISEVVSCETFNIFGLNEFVFYQANLEYQEIFIFFENHNENSCLNGKVVVAYSELVTEKEVNGAKGGKTFNASKLEDYLKTISTRNPAGEVGSAPRVYQERVTGSLEYEIKTENGIKVWADGIDKKTGTSGWIL